MGFLPDDPFSHVFDLGYSVYNDIFFKDEGKYSKCIQIH